MKTRNALLIFSLSLLYNCFLFGQTTSEKAEIEKKIDQCLGYMSLGEKVGQMTQVTLDES